MKLAQCSETSNAMQLAPCGSRGTAKRASCKNVKSIGVLYHKGPDTCDWPDARTAPCYQLRWCPRHLVNGHDAVAEVPAREHPAEEQGSQQSFTNPNLAPDTNPANARVGLQSSRRTICIPAWRRSSARPNTCLWQNSEARAVAKDRMVFMRWSGGSAAAQTTDASWAFEPGLLAFCARQIYPPQQSNPMRVHELTGAPGILAKNDRVDVAAIAPAPALTNSSQHAAR